MSATALEDITMNSPKEDEGFKSFLSDQNLWVVTPLEDTLFNLKKEQKENFDKWVKQIERAIKLEGEFLEQEGINKPTEQVKNLTSYLLYKLAAEDIYPIKLTTTVEEGLYMIFENYPYMLYLEIYNNGDIGYIIEDTRTNNLVEMKDMFSISETKNKISQFYW